MKVCQTPCAECPFKNQILPGWLGGETVDDTVSAALSEQPFLCHLTRGKSNKECAGRLLFAKSSAKMFRNSELESAARKLVAELGTKDILGLRDFGNHHKE